MAKSHKKSTYLTSQYDAKRQYVKKTMPRGKKRAWKRFVKKVNAVNEKSLGSRTIIRNGFNQSSQPSALQITGEVWLYPNRSSSTARNDMVAILRKDNENAPPLPAGTGGAQPSGLVENGTAVFTSGVMDVSFKVPGATTTTVTPGVVTNLYPTLEMDVYEIVFRKTEIDNDYYGDSLQANMTIGLTGTLDLPAGGTSLGTSSALTLTTPGVGPFSVPLAIKQTGMKVLKKTKFIVNPGETITYQIRDPSTHYINKYDINKNSWIGKGTRGIFWTARAVGSAESVNSVLDWSYVKQYVYHVNKSDGFYDANVLT